MSLVMLDEERINKTLDDILSSKEGLMSGLETFDRFTTGFHNGNLYVIGGRPSMGKTTLALNIVRSIALSQMQPVLYVSLEQSESRITAKLLQVISGQETRNLYLKNVPEDKKRLLMEATKKIGKAKLWLEDTPNFSIEALKKLLTKNKTNLDIKFIVIDHLQRMTTSEIFDSRQEEVAFIAKELKNIAVEKNIPILVLSELSRAPECRPDHRPLLSDLRDSGVIEEEADQVFLLYRDRYYYNDSRWGEIAELIVAKNKIGPTGTMYLKFKEEKGLFEDINLDEI